jgi:cysteinyl-tRNA synthetase
MAKIDPNANLYDIDGNLISKAPLKNKTISEVEQLVDDLTKKVEENPDNEVYKVYLNNAQSFLFAMYNNMNKEDLISRISALQSSVEAAKTEVNEAEQKQLEETNKALDELKETIESQNGSSKGVEQRPEEVGSKTVTSEEMESISDEMDQYVEFEEVTA